MHSTNSYPNLSTWNSIYHHVEPYILFLARATIVLWRTGDTKTVSRSTRRLLGGVSFVFGLLQAPEIALYYFVPLKTLLLMLDIVGKR
jgi:uncharacterized membrane protein